MARLIGGWSWTPQHEAEVPVALLQFARRQRVPGFQQLKLKHPSQVEVLGLLAAAAESKGPFL